jgi:hypothetical protein
VRRRPSESITRSTAIGSCARVAPCAELRCLPGVDSGGLLFHFQRGHHLMLPIPFVTANALLVWFVWGFFMALGWVLGTWLMELLLGMVWRRPVRREL